MQDGDDRRDDEEEVAGPAAAPPAARSTERVRIVGAEPAGEATAVIPAVPRSVVPVAPPEESGDPAVRLTGEPGPVDSADHIVQPLLPGETAVPTQAFAASPAEEPGPLPTPMPHWTEAPTGQVPAVLARDEGPAGSSGMSGPTWREEHSDWAAHEREFEPAMFGDDEVSLGSLDETDQTYLDRQPWEFDLPGSGVGRQPGAASVGEGTTGPGPTASDHPGGTGDPGRTGPSREGAGGPDEARAGSDAERPEAPGPERPADPTEAAPGADGGDAIPVRSRTAGPGRAGRDRRGGPRGARVRAKRPTDIDPTIDAPLAAQPPGASVTAVPGAGRRRGGVLGLAAADRDADLIGDPAADLADELDEPPPAIGGAWVDVPDAPDVPPPAEDRPPRAVTSGPAPARRGRGTAGRLAGPTADSRPPGGGPPAPRSPRGRTHGGGRAEPDDRTGRSSIGLRIGTGVAAAVVALVAFALGTAPALVLCTVVVTFAAGECFGVLRRAGYHPATLLGLVGTVSLMVAAYTKGPAAVPLVLVLISAFTLLWYLLGIERGSPVAGTAATLFTVGWISLLGSYSALLLAPSTFPRREGIAFLLGAVIATVANDVGALVVGGWIGRRPLAPEVSPNKTWEGLLGGAVFSVVISAVVVGAIHPWTPARAALLGLVVAVVAPVGDLCESLLKRDLGIKDMGTLLPGHGGVLDRVDALLFVLPATYYLVRALHLA